MSLGDTASHRCIPLGAVRAHFSDTLLGILGTRIAVQPSKASSRDWAHDPRAAWRSREKKNSRQGPPDKTAKTPLRVGYRLPLATETS